MAHTFDTGLALAQRTAIRRAVVAGLEELRKPTLPGAGVLYLAGIGELAAPISFAQDSAEEHFKVAMASLSPVVLVAVGDRNFTSHGGDNEEWTGDLDVHVYCATRSGRSYLARVAGDIASEADISADPGVETIAEHVFERLAGASLASCKAAELRPAREGVAFFGEDVLVFELVFSVATNSDVNPRRALTEVVEEIDTATTDIDDPLTPGDDEDPSTGPPPRTLTEIDAP